MTENELYNAQMKLWFVEHQLIGEQVERTIKHYEELAQINKQELELHQKRTELSKVAFNLWADEYGFPRQE